MIPANLAMNKDFFPFAYIDVHGNPVHELILFLDANLSIRSSIICKDIGNDFTRNRNEDGFHDLVNSRNTFK